MIINATDDDNGNPTISFAVNWSLSSNNQYQAATLSSWYNEDQNDEYYKDLSPSIRSYTFPANAVQGYGSCTDTMLIWRRQT